MTDYRNPNDPFYRDERRDLRHDPDAGSYNATWGWIAGALFLVVILAIAFGVGREPTQTASNELKPPAPVQMLSPAAPSPATPAPKPTAPAPAPQTIPGAQ
jgi:hypothetical protein